MTGSLRYRQASRIINPRGNILIVDEADTLLNTRYFLLGSERSPDKAWINDFLDCSKHKMIWITNGTLAIEKSTMRRFNYALHFPPFGIAERMRLWQREICNHPLRRHLPPQTLRQFARQYRTNAAGITTALKTLAAVISPKNADKESTRRILADLLTRQMEATGDDMRKKLADAAGDQYDPECLNTAPCQTQVVAVLRNFASRLANEHESDRHHLNLLFWGQPGTGKTDFAKYLAGKIDMELLAKRASDLLNPFVGVTEMLIRDAFAEAERERAILLIDEADSMFTNRETARHSWQVSQTNELLTQMENFKGVLICCTNLISHLDPAVLRRFAVKVEFKPLTDKGKIRLFNRYFGHLDQNLDNHQQKELLAIQNLTPGDFKAVYDRYACLPEWEADCDTLIKELAAETAYRSNRKAVGFSPL